MVRGSDVPKNGGGSAKAPAVVTLLGIQRQISTEKKHAPERSLKLLFARHLHDAQPEGNSYKIKRVSQGAMEYRRTPA